MLWQTDDRGASFHCLSAAACWPDCAHSHPQCAGQEPFGEIGNLFPRFLTLHDGRLLLTFTVRANSTDGWGLGVRAVLLGDTKEPVPERGLVWAFTHDRMVIGAQDSARRKSGGGFGNTLEMRDGNLLSAWSYNSSTDLQHHLELVRWAIP